MAKLNLETLKQKYFASNSGANFGYWMAQVYPQVFTAQDIDVLKSCVNMKQAIRYLKEKGHAE